MNVMPVKNYISDCDDAKITRLQQSLPPLPLLNPDQRTPLCSYFLLGNIWCVTWTVCRLHCLALLLTFLWNEGPLRVDSNRRDVFSAECSRWPPSHYLLSSSKQDRGLPPLRSGQMWIIPLLLLSMPSSQSILRYQSKGRVSMDLSIL